MNMMVLLSTQSNHKENYSEKMLSFEFHLLSYSQDFFTGNIKMCCAHFSLLIFAQVKQRLNSRDWLHRSALQDFCAFHQADGDASQRVNGVIRHRHLQRNGISWSGCLLLSRQGDAHSAEHGLKEAGLDLGDLQVLRRLLHEANANRNSSDLVWIFTKYTHLKPSLSPINVGAVEKKQN